MSMEGQGDLFDGLVPPPRDTVSTAPLDKEDLLRTSFVLSNVLMNILIEKGIITEQQVNDLLEDALKEYKKQVKLNDDPQ